MLEDTATNYEYLDQSNVSVCTAYIRGLHRYRNRGVTRGSFVLVSLSDCRFCLCRYTLKAIKTGEVYIINRFSCSNHRHIMRLIIHLCKECAFCGANECNPSAIVQRILESVQDVKTRQKDTYNDVHRTFWQCTKLSQNVDGNCISVLRFPTTKHLTKNYIVQYPPSCCKT